MDMYLYSLVDTYDKERWIVQWTIPDLGWLILHKHVHEFD